ncbi:protein LKAAEAR1 isoform X2 [Tachyglossus aculeatus]|uniref:protein LKAAEAR1 isoform X2 n=1 Tax=Tachyglossus aculeatus TaxID=9261 RepID=UPI0018F4C2B8|nr:protein LKAAEAR1 isoform X2 [Tachyglossus aculeatus]
MPEAEEESKKEFSKHRRALTPKDLVTLSMQQMIRYHMFAEPSEFQNEAKLLPNCSFPEVHKRVLNLNTWQSRESEKERQAQQIGVLRAAEARNRIRALRLRYVQMRAQEIKYLIINQETAQAALRLEALLLPCLNPQKLPDSLDQNQN